MEPLSFYLIDSGYARAIRISKTCRVTDEVKGHVDRIISAYTFTVDRVRAREEITRETGRVVGLVARELVASVAQG